MPNAFIPLREYFVAQRDLESDHANHNGEDAYQAHPKGSPEQALSPEYDSTIAEAISAARRFHVEVAEAVERSLECVLRELACEVLGRELTVLPAEIHAIVERLLAEAGQTTVLRIRVHPDDCTSIREQELPLLRDAALRRGDVVLELQDGVIDASLSVRVEQVLRRVGAI